MEQQETLLSVGEASQPIPGQMAFFPDDPATPQKHHSPRHYPNLSPITLCDAHRVRILICCVLARLGDAIPESWLYEMMVVSGEISFFLYADAMGFLQENGSLQSTPQSDGSVALQLTAVGKACAANLRSYVPKHFRDRVTLTALRYVARQRALRDLVISCEAQADDWVLCIQCNDRAREMLSLRFHAPTKDAADELTARILRNPAGFFGKILDIAMNNEEEVFDLSDN